MHRTFVFHAVRDGKVIVPDRWMLPLPFGCVEHKGSGGELRNIFTIELYTSNKATVIQNVFDNARHLLRAGPASREHVILVASEALTNQRSHAIAYFFNAVLKVVEFESHCLPPKYSF